MKIRSILLAFASATLFVACAKPPAPDTSEADAAAVRSLTEKFVAAWNAGDTATYGAMIADDVVQLPQGAAPNIGHDAVLAGMASSVDIKAVQQSATVEEVVVMGDYANAYGTWRVDPIAAADQTDEPTNGRWMALYRRNAGGDWQIWRWMWNQTGGPPVAAA